MTVCDICPCWCEIYVLSSSFSHFLCEELGGIATPFSVSPIKWILAT